MKHFVTLLESFVIVVLVMAGLAGLAYSTFHEGGWFDAAVAFTAEFVFQNVTISIIVGSVALVGFVLWNERRLIKGTYNKRLPTLVLYTLMAAGTFYIARYALFGSG